MSPTRRTPAPRFLVECYWPGVTVEELERMETRIEVAERPTTDVRYEEAILVPEDDVVFCVYAASSAEEVRAAAERADVPVDRIRSCLRSGRLP